MSSLQRALYHDTNLQIIFGITLMAVLGVASITPAFPAMARELGISPHQIGLLITVFTFPGILLTPVLGVVADRHGRKRVLAPSLILFGIAGTACSLVRDFNLLLVLRFFQGMGAAALGSINVTVIGDLYSGRQRGEAMGYNATVLSLGTASYPAIGGVLATLGWFYPFALPVLAIPLGLLVITYLDNPEPKSEEHFLNYLKNAAKGIKDKRVFGIFTVSIATFIIIYGSYLVYFPLLMDDRFGASPAVIGAFMAVMSLTTASTSSRYGRLAGSHPKKKLLLAGLLLYALSLFIIPMVPNLQLLLVPCVIFGIGHGMNIPSIQTILAELAPLEYRGAFMSLNGMVLRTGQTLGPVVIGAAFALRGLAGAFDAGAGVALLTFVVALVLVGEP